MSSILYLEQYRGPDGQSHDRDASVFLPLGDNALAFSHHDARNPPHLSGFAPEPPISGTSFGTDPPGGDHARPHTRGGVLSLACFVSPSLTLRCLRSLISRMIRLPIACGSAASLSLFESCIHPCPPRTFQLFTFAMLSDQRVGQSDLSRDVVLATKKPEAL